MKKIIFAAIFSLSAIALCIGCGKEEDRTTLIEGLTLENFPVIDGSTSTDPLVKLLASELLGYDWRWAQEGGDITWRISTELPADFVENRLKSSQTHNAFINLIDGKAELIFSARKMSPDEQAYADEAGVGLIETAVALDALIFIEHPGNPVNSLTHPQLEDIYTAKIRNWNEVGGDDLPILPLVRNKNSGSQELMESLVMTEPIPDGFWEDMEEFEIVIQMIPVFTLVSGYQDALGYTIYYYKENMVRDQMHVKTLAINGIQPTKKTIANKQYPFTAEVYAIIRSDLDESSMAYKIYESMQTKSGKRIIGESGYIPN